MKLVTRKEWGARPPKRTPDKFNGPLRGLTVHWGGPRVGTSTHDRCDDKVRGWQNFHMDTKGWNDIAYNWVVCPHGYLYEGRGASASNAANGYRAVNETYLAVCYLGGKGEAFTNEAKQAILELKDYLKAPRLNAHRDHKSTECPGGVIYAWVSQGARPEPKPVTPAPSPEKGSKMYFIYSDAGLDWGTDLIVRRPFESQEDKNAWVALVQKQGGKVERKEFTRQEIELLHPIGTGV